MNLAPLSRLRLACLLLALWAVAGPVQAQEPGQPAAAPPQAPDGGQATMMDMVRDLDWSGWTFLVVLFAFSLVGTTVAIERLVNLRRARLMPRDFLSELEQLVARQHAEPSAFRALVNRYDAPIARILRAGLLRAGRPLSEVEKAMEDAAAHELSSLRGRNRPLAVIASVAPLVGLLGTVFGMIIAFRTTSQAGLGKAELLAEGIYLALLTTAAGLAIAIPALLVVAFLNARVERFMREIDGHLMEVMPCLAQLEQQPAAAAGRQPATRPDLVASG